MKKITLLLLIIITTITAVIAGSIKYKDKAETKVEALDYQPVKNYQKDLASWD